MEVSNGNTSEFTKHINESIAKGEVPQVEAQEGSILSVGIEIPIIIKGLTVIQILEPSANTAKLFYPVIYLGTCVFGIG